MSPRLAISSGIHHDVCHERKVIAESLTRTTPNGHPAVRWLIDQVARKVVGSTEESLPTDHKAALGAI
jgi:hypothetical protein